MTKKPIKKIADILWKNKILILIIILGLFLRLYHLQNSINFSWDQERDAFTIKQMVLEKKPVLIGPRVVNDNGFMLGPYFFYILLPFYLITSFNPFATIIFIAFYNLVFLISSFLIIKKIFSQKIAYLFIFIWSVLPLAIYIDTISWNPLLVPFLIIFLLYMLKTLNFSKTKSWLLLGLFLGFSFNIHVQLAILSFTGFIYLFIKIPKNIFFKKIGFLFLGFIISFLPLIIFDLRHNFLNLHLFLNFFQGNHLPKNYFSFIPVWNNYIFSAFSLKSNILAVIFWLILLVVLFKLSKKNIFNKILLFTWIFFPIVFVVYGQRPSEYYFNFCLPIIILVLSQLFSKLKINQHLIIFICFLISIYSIYSKYKQDHLSSFSLANKTIVAKHIKDVVGNQKFNLSYSVSGGQNSGFAYLLDFYKIKPSGDPKDPLIQIIIPAQNKYKSFGDISIDFPYPFNQ